VSCFTDPAGLPIASLMEPDFDGVATVMEPPIARVMEPFPDTWPVTEQDDRDVSYTTLRCWAQTELGFGGRSPTVRIDDLPAGEEAQVDFGLMGYVSGEGGGGASCTCSSSRCRSAATNSCGPRSCKQTEALIDELDAAWAFFGGVPHRVVLDNMTAAIVRASAKDPTINPSFAEYAQARAFFVDPARVGHPRDKARVENQVPFARERWFAVETFSDDIKLLRVAATRWSQDVAGARIHGTTRRVPRRVFEAEERSFLLPAPDAPFDVPRWTEPKVHPDHPASSDPSSLLGRGVAAIGPHRRLAHSVTHHPDGATSSPGSWGQVESSNEGHQECTRWWRGSSRPEGAAAPGGSRSGCFWLWTLSWMGVLFLDRGLGWRAAGLDVGLEPRSVRFAFNHEIVGVVGESIYCALSEEHVIEHGEPLVGVAVTGDERGCARVALDEELIDISAFFATHGLEREVVNDEQIDSAQVSEHCIA